MRGESVTIVSGSVTSAIYMNTDLQAVDVAVTSMASTSALSETSITVATAAGTATFVVDVRIGKSLCGWGSWGIDS
jgi:hypothetical protein